MTVPDYDIAYPRIRWVDRTSLVPLHNGWFTRVCLTEPGSYTVSDTAMNDFVLSVIGESKTYRVSLSAVVFSTEILLEDKRGTPGKEKILLVGTRKEFESVMKLAEWNANKYLRYVREGSDYRGISHFLLANSCDMLWKRYLVLSDKKPEYPKPTMAVRTSEGILYATPDPPPNIIVVVNGYGVRNKVSGSPKAADAVIHVDTQKMEIADTPNGKRMVYRADSIPFLMELVRYTNNDSVKSAQIALIGSAILDYEIYGDDSGCVALKGTSVSVDTLLLSALRVWNTQIPAYNSSLVN